MEPFNIYREVRPWGVFEEFIRNGQCTVKIITVNPGQALSLQTHEKREEFWRVISGEGFATIGNSHIQATLGSEFIIPPNTQHRLEASEHGQLLILEISRGQFDEKDVVRIKDNYGRANA